MNRALIIAGIAIVAISKVLIFKSILIDTPAYEACITKTPFDTGPIIPMWACGSDPFMFFIIGWFVTVGGFILIFFGLKMPATRSISR